MRRFGWCVVALVLVALGWAATADARQAGRPSTYAPTEAASLEREARQIETMLIAPCCWREQVSVHQSEAAEQVKRDVRAMLAAGLTRQQVLDRFVESYGMRILAEPPDRGFGRVLHHAPWVVGLASVIGLGFFIRHVTRRRNTAGQPDENAGPAGPLEPVIAGAGAPTEDDYRQRLDDELRDLD